MSQNRLIALVGALAVITLMDASLPPQVTTKLPDGVQIAWTVDKPDAFRIEVQGDGLSAKIYPTASAGVEATLTFTAGNIVVSQAIVQDLVVAPPAPPEPGVAVSATMTFTDLTADPNQAPTPNAGTSTVTT